MFDVSFTELMVIGVIALVVIGPERLPKVARTIGHLLGRAQRYVNDVKSDIRREIELDELRKFKDEMDETARSMQTSLRETEDTLRDSTQALRAEFDETARDASKAVNGADAPAESAPAVASDTDTDTRSIAPPAAATPADKTPPTGSAT
ncbi:Sec-independent protein translocase protein TatB [Bordetella bronchiseptica]|uniref:Sec-independent protein translocase protein TatB n=1 Tax=Bordetella bronchiseptica TaxID=518 RepID=UPI00049F42E7|nr:Sec-independent protein translocase protein TatB [Bordetella bronchiseptica]KDD82666.1 twin arginine-targeting protein translocase TatB [Bordetella bronchiseptica MO275]QET69910.1 twin-arginine translocase subunit TatB [Bordetella bronchiseptica]QIY00745.1 twin-arginine translocase subunit TatB [Bordetella bronchiseptica]RSB98037.1 twin-arginine translocase subunit TatB [Bordetella bronchiseptica]RSC07092.1 twin-arginine translocase subunit TatB [Bordetella bronchiseptica]